MPVTNQLHKNYLTRCDVYQISLRATNAVDYGMLAIHESNGMLAIHESNAPFSVTTLVQNDV